MIPRKYHSILFIALMSATMTIVMSFVMTLINTRLDAGFPNRWLRCVLIGYIAALPTALLTVPVTRRIVDRLCR